MTSSSIFSKIINRDISSHIVAEDEKNIAFLDINPIKKGHTLVVPKQEIDYIFDLDDKSLSDLHLFSKKVAQAIKKVIPCSRMGLSVVGLDVPHAHIHLIPIDKVGDVSFSNPKLQFTDQEMSELAKQISEVAGI